MFKNADTTGHTRFQRYLVVGKRNLLELSVHDGLGGEVRGGLLHGGGAQASAHAQRTHLDHSDIYFSNYFAISIIYPRVRFKR